MDGSSPQIPARFTTLSSAQLPPLYWLCPGPCSSLLHRGRDRESVEQLPFIVHEWEGLTWDTAVVEFGCQDPQVESCDEVIRHHLWQGWMLVSWSKRVLTRQVATQQSNSTCIPGYTCSGSLPPSLLCLEQSKGLWLGGQHHIVDAIQSPEL